MRSHKYIVRTSKRGSRYDTKNKSRAIALAATIFLFAVIIFGATWLSQYESITISKIETMGNKIISSSEIESIVWDEIGGKYIYLINKKNSFLYPKNRIINSILNEYQRVLSVSVGRSSNKSLYVDIVERKPAYLWCGEFFDADKQKITEESCYFMDKDGFVFAKAPYFSGNPFFTFYGVLFGDGDMDNSIGMRFFDEDRFSEIILLKDAIEQLGFAFERFVSIDDRNYELHADNGVRIIFEKDQDINILFDNLNSVLEEIPDTENLEYIDLRFGNKVFYK